MVQPRVRRDYPWRDCLVCSVVSRFPVSARLVAPLLESVAPQKGNHAAGMNQLPPQRLHGSEHGGIHEKTVDHYGAVLFSGHRFHRSSRGTARWLYQRCDRRRYRWSFHGTRRNWGGCRVCLWHASAERIRSATAGDWPLRLRAKWTSGPTEAMTKPAEADVELPAASLATK